MSNGSMEQIDLKNKTEPLVGTIESYWVENQNIGLEKTLFYRIIVPLKPFNSGLDYVEQPEETEFIFDWIEVAENFEQSINNKLILSSELNPRIGVSIYLGSAHSTCNVSELALTKLTAHKLNIRARLDIDFRTEGIADNETFNFETQLERN